MTEGVFADSVQSGLVSNWLNVAVQAANSAGSALTSAGDSWRSADSSIGRDIKLRADREAETIILEALKKTGLPVLSEEAGLDKGSQDSEWMWVVDPLDGTFNFQRNLPIWCVSIGLLRRGQPYLGAIFDPVEGRTASGVVGQGAFENGCPLKVSSTALVDQAALVTGFPIGRDYSTESLNRFIENIREFKKIRMLGSAASSLLAVARGRVDVYYEEGIALWDIAGGAALVRAAGGTVVITNIEKGHRVTVCASNTLIMPALTRLLQ